jgi:hypothetical protein
MPLGRSSASSAAHLDGSLGPCRIVAQRPLARSVVGTGAGPPRLTHDSVLLMGRRRGFSLLGGWTRIIPASYKKYRVL